MNNNYKYLVWSGTAVLVILGVFLLVSTNKTWNTATTTNTVSFSGEGKVITKPNIAKIQLSIVTDALTSKAAQDDNSKKSKAVTDYLKKQDIDDKDIKTTSYNIYPQYKYPRYGGQPTITGYQVNQSMEVKVRDLDKVSNILDGVVAAGTNQVNSLSFEIDDPEALKADARKKAIADAKKKAEELEDQLGIDLGKIVNFSENTGGYPIPIYVELKADGRGGMGGDSPSVPTGENEIVVNVSLTYQIK
ncbi:MAG: SIMPL domain-containing protein [Candidatus Yanofskybacteria bacterium]|nr:SIMPL domain-containing protein [Candidatus Yanofskybacteria bacterium]